MGGLITSYYILLKSSIMCDRAVKHSQVKPAPPTLQPCRSARSTIRQCVPSRLQGLSKFSSGSWKNQRPSIHSIYIHNTNHCTIYVVRHIERYSRARISMRLQTSETLTTLLTSVKGSPNDEMSQVTCKGPRVEDQSKEATDLGFIAQIRD